jgi:hypothetical protein
MTRHLRLVPRLALLLACASVASVSALDIPHLTGRADRH